MNNPTATAADFFIQLKSKGGWGIFTALLICWISKHGDRIIKITFLSLTVSPPLLNSSPLGLAKISAFTYCRLTKPPQTSQVSRGYYNGNAYSYDSDVSAIRSVLIHLEVSDGWESFLWLVKLHLELKVDFVWSHPWHLRSKVPAAQRLASVTNVCSLAKWSWYQE